ncbi:hypothetical protein [Eggerthella lenta]|uniref:hypothetical protein n=1 Tax=Eggerthella lenta TaxID=84112 RepID=UPI0022DF6BB3|nr:hypothetical protein [Eggerthella lenta]
MGGRGSWSATAKGERIGKSGGRAGTPSEKIPASQFQTIDGNRVSKSATFANVEKQIAAHTYETGVIVDGQGFVLAARKGGKNSVNFGSDSGKVKGNIVTHNHPSGAAAFSVADIRSTGNLGGIGIRATTKENGTAVLAKASNNPQWDKMASAYSRYLGSGRTVAQAQDWLKKSAPRYGLRFTLER